MNFAKHVKNIFKFGNKFKLNPKVYSVIKGDTILVLSPHFDDEIIGCGGALRKHWLSGANIHVVYMTDGSSNFYSKDKDYAFLERSSESLKAMNIIGGCYSYYFKISEGNMSIDNIVIEKISKLIDKIKPDLIYIPWFLDKHHDHLMTNLILFECYKKNKFKAMICSFEVWQPLSPNVLVDITDVIDNKIEALYCFQSQLIGANYPRLIEGLNRYRSALSGNGNGFAEAFLMLPARKYFNLFKLIK